jgi:hypothetical protein
MIINLVIYIFRVKHESPKNNRFSGLDLLLLLSSTEPVVRQFSSLLFISLLVARAPTLPPPLPGGTTLYAIYPPSCFGTLPDNQKTFSLTQTTLGRASLTRFIAEQIICRPAQVGCCFPTLGGTIAVMLCINSLVWKSVRVPDKCR